jgi:hypothetical protein
MLTGDGYRRQLIFQLFLEYEAVLLSSTVNGRLFPNRLSSHRHKPHNPHDHALPAHALP